MAIKNALRLRARKTFSGAGLATLYSDNVERDQLYCIQQIAWEISKATSGGNTRVRLFIAGHGYRHNLEEQDAPAADTLYTYSEPVWIVPGERIALDIDQAQASTVAEMCLTGYSSPFKEGIQ